MCRRNIRESLTARIFLLTLLLLLGAGGLTFGLIAWATPITYVSVVGDRLQVQVSELTDRLALTKLADAGPILDVFVRESGAAVSLASPDGESVDTGSLYVSVTTAVQESDSVSTYTYGADGGPAQRERAGHYVTTALSDALIAEVTFADRAETYQLLVVPPMRLANQAVEALNRAAPCLALALLAFSLLCAVGYSRYLARPIVRISSIAGRMAELDFQWKCGETRRDEIGALGRSLDEMAERLSAALAELEEANAALRGDMERARELERQRLAFFSAASHELKTPVTILKGQLSGMLDGVGVYRDREKYLARSLQVAGRMEALVGELLAVSRMESDGASRREVVELSALTAEKLAQDAELLEQRGISLEDPAEPDKAMPPVFSRVYPIPEGILRDVRHQEAENGDSGYQMMSVCGLQNVMSFLKELSAGDLPFSEKGGKLFVELNSCEGGCVNGPLIAEEKRAAYRGRLEVDRYVAASAERGEAASQAEETPPLSAGMEWRFTPDAPRKDIPDEATIRRILTEIGKPNPDKELNCGSCGYSTCRDKAIAVYQGKAELYMCLPYINDLSQSLSSVTLSVTPNMVIAVDRDLRIIELNLAAQKTFGVSRQQALKAGLFEYMDPADFEEVFATHRNIVDKKVRLESLSMIARQTLVYVENQDIVMGFLQDITEEEQRKEQTYRARLESAEMAQKVIEKQMIAAQEIASLLGETTAETKVTLNNLNTGVSLSKLGQWSGKGRLCAETVPKRV